MPAERNGTDLILATAVLLLALAVVLMAAILLRGSPPAEEEAAARTESPRAWYEAIWHELAVEPAVRPPAGRGAGEVILWWEDRRGRYNLIVLLSSLALGAIGVALGGFKVSAVYTAVGVAFLLQVTCNFWYTGGWIAELLVRLVAGDRLLGFGPAALVAGEVFSVLFAGAGMFTFARS